MTSNTIFALVFAVLALCVGFSAAVLVRSTPTDEERVQDFTISAAKDIVSWRAFGREWVVHLELSTVVEDNMDYFHGTLEGDASAVVSFALLPGTGLSGMIVTGGTTWWIRAMPVRENGMSEAEDALRIFMVREQGSPSSSLPLPPLADPLHAESGHEEQDDSSSSNDSEGKKRTMTSYKVAVFYDQNFASASNNPWSSQANTMGLLNDVNAVYKAAGLNTFTFVYQKQVSNSYSTLSDMLTYFSNTASTSLSAFKDTSYTNYVWLVGHNVGGLAYVGTSCKGTAAAQNTKTAVTGLVNYSRLWTIKTIAHELGHNRGALHQFTDACSSTLTTNCQCSEMSYCFPSATNNPMGAVNYFTQYTIDQMHTAGCY